MEKNLKILLIPLFILIIFMGILASFFWVCKIFLPEVPKSQILTKTNQNNAEKILEELALEQKVGQLFIVGIEGKILTLETRKLIETLHPGGILLLAKNIENSSQLKNLIKELQTISLKNSGLPLFVAVDQEGEPMSRIRFAKEKTSQSEIKDKEDAFQIGKDRGKELKELGINLNLAPVLDLTQPTDFLNERSFQKNPQETGELSRDLIAGQKTAGVLTAIKHFPGYGGISFNPEEKLAVLANVPKISQFEIAIEQTPEMVMTSNVIYSDIDKEFPFTFSPKAIEFLKENLGEDVLIISDDLAQNSLLNKFSLEEIVTLPIRAGVDILIFSGWRAPVASGILVFREALREGKISEEEINRSVLKIIKLKQNLLQ